MVILQGETNDALDAPLPPEPKECEHSSESLRIAYSNNGASRYVYQCNQCGRLQNVAKKLLSMAARAKATPVDRTIQERWWKQQQEARTTHYQAKRARERTIWLQNYNEYLVSPEWQTKRAKELKRAGGLCEGCGDRRPVQVHHLTYAHLRDEPLYELAALCYQCHMRLHKDREQ